MRKLIIFSIGILFLSSISLLIHIDRDSLLKRIDSSQQRNNLLNLEIFDLKEDLMECYKRDSLYRIHLENCSFIAKDQLYITKDRYLKVKKATNFIRE